MSTFDRKDVYTRVLRHSRETTHPICRAPHMGWYAESRNMPSVRPPPPREKPHTSF